jgi:hypothetical protein
LLRRRPVPTIPRTKTYPWNPSRIGSPSHGLIRFCVMPPAVVCRSSLRPLSHGPDKAQQFARRRRHGFSLFLASSHQRHVALVQTVLRFPCTLGNLCRKPFLAPDRELSGKSFVRDWAHLRMPRRWALQGWECGTHVGCQDRCGPPQLADTGNSRVRGVISLLAAALVLHRLLVPWEPR